MPMAGHSNNLECAQEDKSTNVGKDNLAHEALKKRVMDCFLTLEQSMLLFSQVLELPKRAD